MQKHALCRSLSRYLLPLTPPGLYEHPLPTTEPGGTKVNPLPIHSIPPLTNVFQMTSLRNKTWISKRAETRPQP